MSRQRTSGSRGCILLILALGCLVAAAGGLAASELPRWAVNNFGFPSTKHGWGMRVYLSAQLYIHRFDLTQPMDTFGKEREFEISLGELPGQVAQRLQETGFIRNAEALRIYLVYSGLDTTLQAGVFQLSPAWSAVEIAQEMQDATPTEVNFRLIPGWRLEEIASALPVNGVAVDPQEFIRAAQNPGGGWAGGDWPADQGVEGLLSPDTYRIARTASVEEVINLLSSRFFEQVSEELRGGFRRQGLDMVQAVTLASIVQREAVIQDEMPMIASVFLNRLAVNMKLDSDPTVQYALGYQNGRGGWWTNPLSLADLQIDSPYNTYIYTGLPPGPIANPSLEALQSVAQPAQTPYFYFRAACDGSGRHNFAITFNEHLNNACP